MKKLKPLIKELYLDLNVNLSPKIVDIMVVRRVEEDIQFEVEIDFDNEISVVMIDAFRKMEFNYRKAQEKDLAPNKGNILIQ